MGENTALTAVYNTKDGVLVIKTSGTPFKEVSGNKVQVYDRNDHGKWADLKSPVIRDKYIVQVMSTTDKNILKDRTNLGIYYHQEWAKDTDGNHLGAGDNSLSQISATAPAISSAAVSETDNILTLTMNENIETISAGSVSMSSTLKGMGGLTRTGQSASISDNVITISLSSVVSQTFDEHVITIKPISIQTTSGAWNSGTVSYTISLIG